MSNFGHLTTSGQTELRWLHLGLYALAVVALLQIMGSWVPRMYSIWAEVFPPVCSESGYGTLAQNVCLVFCSDMKTGETMAEDSCLIAIRAICEACTTGIRILLFGGPIVVY